MNHELESFVTGALVGAILLGVMGGWFGLAIMMMTSWWASWVSWKDIFRIALLAGGIGLAIGSIVGLATGVIRGETSHALVGALTGSFCLCFWGIGRAFDDSSSKNVQINRAIANGFVGLLFGAIPGVILGWLIGLLLGIANL